MNTSTMLYNKCKPKSDHGTYHKKITVPKCSDTLQLYKYFSSNYYASIFFVIISFNT